MQNYGPEPPTLAQQIAFSITMDNTHLSMVSHSSMCMIRKVICGWV